ADPETGEGKLRVHFVDEGPSSAAPVLLMHGEPSWSYLYRHMIPPLVEAGHRVVAPDLVGFGRSDKPAALSDYTYARHVAWMSSLLFDSLDLHDITFFGQDWGGLVGLRLVAADPDRYARVVIGNTGLPTGHGPASKAFLAWQLYSQETPVLEIGKLVSGGCARDLSPEEVAAYDAPFPDDTYKAGARIFPTLVPTSAEDPASKDNEIAWSVLSRFERPFVLAYSDGDPITAGGDAPFRAKVPGAQGAPHTTIEGAGHFLQEDKPAELARVISDAIARG
ncbi:MAG: haloalkane dehalogenase, partial [Acidimicrobiia bacterium]|nr:haloalkane dehalogenase [Acidimicrobiia bacterium]